MGGVRVLVGHAKGSVCPYFGREAQGLGHRRAALRGLGDLPPEGLPGRSRPDICLAVHELVRTVDPAIHRRGSELGAGQQPVRLRRSARHSPVVRRHSAPLGVRPRVASRTLPHRSRHRSRRRRGHGPVFLERWRAKLERVAGLRGHGSGSAWRPAAGGCACARSSSTPAQPRRGIFSAISAAGVFRHLTTAGTNWRPVNKGLRSGAIPDEDAEVGHCVHRLARHPSRPEVLYMQKHWDVMKSKDAGESWEEVSGDLPTDFGFAIDVHAHEPETVYVVPIKSDSEHFPPEGKLRVSPVPLGRQRVGTPHKRTASGELLCERAARRDGGRLTRVLRGLLRHDRGPGLRILRFWRQLGPDSARSPRVLSVEVQTL